MFRKLAVVLATTLGLIAIPSVQAAQASPRTDTPITQSAPSQMELVYAASDVQVYKGFHRLANINISVKGSGAWVSGNLRGRVSTNNYEALYQIYQLSASESSRVWFLSWSHERKYDEIKKVFEAAESTFVDINMDYRLQGNDFGITSVSIGYDVIRIDVAGVSKYFTVVNDASAGAKNPADGSDYIGGFEAY